MQSLNSHQEGTLDDFKRIKDLVDTFFGSKAKRLSISIQNKSLQYLLYNSFEVIIQIGDRYGEFGAGIRIGTILLGPEILPDRSIKMAIDEDTIIENLRIIEDYCRLSLPDKFLQYHGW